MKIFIYLINYNALFLFLQLMKIVKNIWFCFGKIFVFIYTNINIWDFNIIENTLQNIENLSIIQSE